MTAPTCMCPCRGCVAFHVHAEAEHLAINEEELALALTLAVSDSLRSRGIDPARPEVTQAVELVLTSATALARQLGQLIDEPADAGLRDCVQSSVGLLAADLAAIVGDSPRAS